jgi:hypothetical protein
MGRRATCRERYVEPFIVDVPATLLKRNTELSKAARVLYSTMRSLADGKTGALKIRNRWLKAKAIDAAAEMCRDVRLRAMRELVALGLASMERERVERVIKGRKRVVFGITRYFVHRQPAARKKTESKPFLLKSISSTVEKIDSQVFSNPPVGAVSEGSGVLPVVSENEKGEVSHHHPEPPKPDDDLPSRFEKLQNTARAILVERGEDAEFVEAAIQFIDERSAALGRSPGSAAYYLASFQTLQHSSEEMAAIWETVKRRRELREKWMPGFTGELSPDSETHRQEFNRYVERRANADEGKGGL